jgi:acetyl-CoA carboxylase carboxyl transferase beta subunit
MVKLSNLLNFKKEPDANTKTKDDIIRVCSGCKKEHTLGTLMKNHMICPDCKGYFRMEPRQRVDAIADSGSFAEMYSDLQSTNLLSFPDYDKKLSGAIESSGESEAVLCGTCEIGGHKCALFIMNSYFMMGSMGTIVGEKITRIFEYATEHSLPVVGFTTSGGARMQEGVLSLMQMAKVSGAVKRHSDAGNLYLTVLTDPTTGGVTASFAMEGDIILAEPNALVGFAGARVIEQTTGQKLPEGFQRSEFLLEHGFVDIIAERENLKAKLSSLLAMHER